ncbi:MAG: (d)CMP kinase [Candidatus Izemoplasma sp.]
MNYIQIAIDGPAGAGKSTVAKLLSKRLDFIYIDTGAMYRAITLKAINMKVDLNEEDQFDFLEQTSFTYTGSTLLMDGKDISGAIRGNEVSSNVSMVSSHYCVREKLVDIQQQMAKNRSVVMDGRDIGYVVLPDAKYKYYVTASIKERASRRYKDNLNRGIKGDLDAIEKDIERRDYLDQTRAHNPLKPAEDAIIIDTSDLSITQVVEFIAKKIREGENHGF